MGNGQGRYLIHYLPRRGGPLPPCVQGRGGVSADTRLVNCGDCRRSLRFAMDDFTRAYRALFRAVIGRRDGLRR